MNVSGVGGNAYTNVTGQSNPQIKAIDKQIAELKKSIQEVKANKDLDVKTKSEKIKEYEKKIAQLQQQKLEIQAEERKEKQAQNSQSAQNAEAEREAEKSKGGQMKDSTQKALIEMDGAMQSVKKLGVVRADIEGKLRTAESTAYSAAGSRQDPVAAAEYRSRINDIDNVMVGKAKKAAAIMKEEDLNIVGADEEELWTVERIAREANSDENENKGTGRFEAGQFLYEEV